MKRNLTLAIFLLGACTAYAQGLSGGLKFGLNVANQKMSLEGLSVSTKALSSFHLGGYLNVSVTQKLSIQPELLYSVVGTKADDFESKFSYLSLPIMVKYNVASVFHIHAGPQIGMLVTAEVDGDDVKDSLKNTDFGLGMGAGVDLPMGLNFSARYVVGLSDVYDGERVGTKIKNNIFQFSLGYRLFGGK